MSHIIFLSVTDPLSYREHNGTSCTWMLPKITPGRSPKRLLTNLTSTTGDNDSSVSKTCLRYCSRLHFPRYNCI